MTCTPTHHGSSLQKVGHLLQYLFAKMGILSSIAVHAMGCIRSQPELAEPDIAMSFLPLSIGLEGGHPTLAKEAGVTIGSQVLRPSGRSRIRLRDTNVASRPIIEHALLSHERDLSLTIQSCRLVANVFAAPALQAHVLGDHEPATLPQTDREWEAYARQRVGSCHMGSDELAVVDPALKVRDIQGLRVVDAAVMPNITSGNTNAATIALAEKAAELIRALA